MADRVIASIAEAMALLQELRGVHPSQDITVYRHNDGFILNRDKGRGDDPSGRLQQGGRAVEQAIGDKAVHGRARGQCQAGVGALACG